MGYPVAYRRGTSTALGAGLSTSPRPRPLPVPANDNVGVARYRALPAAVNDNFGNAARASGLSRLGVGGLRAPGIRLLPWFRAVRIASDALDAWEAYQAAQQRHWDYDPTQWRVNCDLGVTPTQWTYWTSAPGGCSFQPYYEPIADTPYRGPSPPFNIGGNYNPQWWNGWVSVSPTYSYQAVGIEKLVGTPTSGIELVPEKAPTLLPLVDPVPGFMNPFPKPGVSPFPLPLPYPVIPYVKPNPGLVEQSDRGPVPSTPPVAETINFSVSPNVVPVPPHRFRPPGPGVKEVKGRASVAGVPVVLGVVNGVSEALDALDAVHDALPSKYQAKPVPIGNGKWRAATAIEKGRALYRNADKIDLGQALANLIKEQVQDAFFGRIGNAAKKAVRSNPFYVRPVGLQAGGGFIPRYYGG